MPFRNKRTIMNSSNTQKSTSLQKYKYKMTGYWNAYLQPPYSKASIVSQYYDSYTVLSRLHGYLLRDYSES